MYQVKRMRMMVGIVAAALLWGCGATPAAPAATATVLPTVPPTATAVPVVASGVSFAGTSVAGKTQADVAAVLATFRPPAYEMNVSAGDQSLAMTLTKLTLDTEATLSAIMAASAGSTVAPVFVFDEAEITAQLDAWQAEFAAQSGVSLVDGEGFYDASFVTGTAQTFVVADARDAVLAALANQQSTVTLQLQPMSEPVLPSATQLQEGINEMAANWPGIVGVYVYNLDTNEVVATLNENTVFSGASVMKVSILIHAYANLSEFTDDDVRAMRRMIIDSDNLAANRMLAASVRGVGTESAYQGTLSMNEMFKSLGLEHTYQNLPYEAREYLINVLNYNIQGGPKQEGQPPFTDADPMLRTTPAEMASVFVELYRCSQGEGKLVELYPDTLNAERCGEMLDLMHQNADYSRMMSGLPEDAYVSHKSGWIEDMQADVGIITTPNNQHFVMAVYVYRDIAESGGYLLDEVAGPVIGGFARLIYSAYMPETATK